MLGVGLTNGTTAGAPCVAERTTAGVGAGAGRARDVPKTTTSAHAKPQKIVQFLLFMGLLAADRLQFRIDDVDVGAATRAFEGDRNS